MQYMLLIYNCDRPDPTDPGFPEALARVNAFAEECRRRGALVAGDPLQIEVRPIAGVPGLDHTPANL